MPDDQKLRLLIELDMGLLVRHPETAFVRILDLELAALRRDAIAEYRKRTQ